MLCMHVQINNVILNKIQGLCSFLTGLIFIALAGQITTAQSKRLFIFASLLCACLFVCLFVCLFL